MSATDKFALRDPDAFGENTAVIRQLLFGERMFPLQPSLPIEKSETFVPVIVAAIPESGAFPVLVKVTIFNVTLESD